MQINMTKNHEGDKVPAWDKNHMKNEIPENLA